MFRTDLPTSHTFRPEAVLEKGIGFLAHCVCATVVLLSCTSRQIMVSHQATHCYGVLFSPQPYQCLSCIAHAACHLVHCTKNMQKTGSVCIARRQVNKPTDSSVNEKAHGPKDEHLQLQAGSAEAYTQ